MLQGLCISLWFVLVPLFMGMLVLRIFHREEEGMILGMILGYITMFAVFEVIAIPMILTRRAFHELVYVTAGVFLLCLFISVILNLKTMVLQLVKTVSDILHTPWTVFAALGLVALQCYYYIKYMITNLDDAYYVAVASVALKYDTMYQRSPYTGMLVDSFNMRYVLSPYSILQAFWARCTGFTAPEIAHTVLPPFLVCLAYMVYFQMGKFFFDKKRLDPGSDQNTTKLAALFVAMVCVVNITSAYYLRNSGSVLLVRVWQGKATLAAVLLPFLFYQLYQMGVDRAKKGNVCILFLLMTACCLVSSMGVVLAPVMAGLFIVLFGLLLKRWRYIYQVILCCSPCLVIGICYLLLKAAQE